MTRSISWCILISALAVVVACAVAMPQVLSNGNQFLNGFVNHELLAILGIIMTITLASAASLHLEFNKIEERYKKEGLRETRRGVKQGAYCLIVLFLVAVVLVVVRPLAAGTPAVEALFNGTALILLLWNVLVLIELTQLAFSIKADLN